MQGHRLIPRYVLSIPGAGSNRRRCENLMNHVDEATEQAVVAEAIEQRAHGQHRTSNELRTTGIFVSGTGVRSI